jgi:hydrogenase nickel incorporation protein HypA/HybF
MHELSVALGIVKIAETEAKKAKAKSVVVIELDIGTLAGIEFQSLDFVWPVAVKGTILENSTKKVNKIRGKAECTDCKTIFEIDNYYDSCPKCQSFLKNILQGKELRVKTLEIS